MANAISTSPSDESFTSSSGLRMGVSEMTRFGMQEEDFKEFAVLFSEAVKGRNVANEVSRFREKFQTMKYCFDIDFREHKDLLAKMF